MEACRGRRAAVLLVQQCRPCLRSCMARLVQPVRVLQRQAGSGTAGAAAMLLQGQASTSVVGAAVRVLRQHAGSRAADAAAETPAVRPGKQ